VNCVFQYKSLRDLALPLFIFTVLFPRFWL